MATSQKSNTDGEDADELGTAAEEAFRYWCSAADRLTVTSPGKDKHGWDFYVQERDAFDPALGPLDQRPSELAFKVQVKGITGKGCRVPIKLDNWHRMTAEIVPWFVVVFRFNNSQKAPEAAYLIHIDRNHAEQVLTRLRKLSPSDAKRVHKIKIILRWSEQNRLEFPDGHELKKAISRYIGNTLEYATNKIRTISEVGYEKRPYTMNLTVSGESREDVFFKLSNFAIGARKNLSINRSEATLTRFGISQPVSRYDGISEISIPKLPHSGFIYITISDRDHTRSVTVKCKVYDTASIFPFLPTKHRKFRLASRLVTFIAETDGDVHAIRPQVHFSPKDKPTSLSSFVKVGKTILLLGMAEHNGLRLSLRRDLKDVASHINPVATQTGIEDWLMEYAAVFECLGTIAVHFGIDPGICLIDAFIASQQHQITLLASILDHRVKMPFKATVTIDSSDSYEGKPCAIVTAIRVTLGEYICAAVFSAEGSGSFERTTSVATDLAYRLSVEDGRVRIHKKHTIPVPE
jgi:hypothetical protein